MGNKGRQDGQSQGGGRGVAHAPYNFVPLPDQVVPAEPLPDHDCYHADRHSGHFTVTLTTETPLYIRGMLTKDEADEQEKNKSKYKDKPDFFQRNGKPVIPGSSLRGMLRSLVEIVAFGKLQPISDRRLIYRAAFDLTSLGDSYRRMTLGERRKDGAFDYPSPRLLGGYLRQAGSDYYIQPARKFEGESFVFVNKDGLGRLEPQSIHEVWVKPARRSNHRTTKKDIELKIAISEKASRVSEAGLQKAVLVVSGRANNRRWHPAIFEPDNTAPLKPISDELWKQYEEDRDMKRGIDARKLMNDGDPLFYLVDENGQLIFFGPTLMFRLLYAHSLADLIPANGEVAGKMDMAEAIFGWARRGEDKQDTHDPVASRVSVSDAVTTLPKQSDDKKQPDFYEGEFTPKILGGPKPTTFQHYLEQPNGERTDKKTLVHYATKPKPKLRGHKLYWRQRGTQISHIQESDKSKQRDTQHTRMKPVKTGVTFKFTVRFENLTAAELGALAWALYLPCSAEHRHQLGMGKPYGMGVVKLTPTLHLIDRKARYTQLFDGDGWATAERQEAADEYIKAFEEYIVKQLGIKQDFRGIERIRELCVMLTPQERRTAFEYMTIAPNEYKERPVLPPPSKVIRPT